MMDNPNTIPGEDVKKALIGLSRDIRGLAYSFNQKNPYMMLFDFIYPTYSPILIRGVEIWAHDPSVTTPVLKFFSELVSANIFLNFGIIFDTLTATVTRYKTVRSVWYLMSQVLTAIYCFVKLPN